MGSSLNVSEQTLIFMYSFITIVEQQVYSIHRHKMAPPFCQQTQMKSKNLLIAEVSRTTAVFCHYIFNMCGNY